MREYTVIKNELNNCQIIWYEEDGVRYSFTDKDPANSDYQAYLNKDNPQVEHLTEIPTVTE